MSFAFLVIVFHIVQICESRLCTDRIALVSGVVNGPAGYAASDVWFTILKSPSIWSEGNYAGKQCNGCGPRQTAMRQSE